MKPKRIRFSSYELPEPPCGDPFRASLPRASRMYARLSGWAYVAVLSVSLLLSCGPGAPVRTLVPENYASWGRTTELRLDYPIPGHEDNLRIIYMNSVGQNPTRTGEGATERIVFPEGTIIAKEVYVGSSPEPGSSPIMVTAMIKDLKHPEARGGWIWVAKDLAMGKETIMTGTFCFSCHANANEAHPYGDKNPNENFRDYVFFLPDSP